ncbi:myeloid-associated differentiation marker-like [Paralichthys olivaceus]|uniref:myeloid-associated differentiation marker-like n=1 Tax=Paralichthys olivaceus TaxID=8255 RepID=UPI00097D1D88|nr:PREDICTED: myeloid-associated differentiation marker-like [Paralichthys olivaceus]
MPLIMPDTKDLTSPLFLVRTWEVLSSCATFSLVSSLEYNELNKNTSQGKEFIPFNTFCMFTWCFFFILTLLIHIVSALQFHRLIPVSWKNLIVTVAVLGALMSLGACIFLSSIIVDYKMVSPLSVAAVVCSSLTFLAYFSESYILCTQAKEQRGYMGSMPGILKIFQLWGGCQMSPLVHWVLSMPPTLVPQFPWELWVTIITYAVCTLTCAVTLIVILGDCTGRCLLPFDKCMTGFSLTGVLLYMVSTAICFTEILQLREPGKSIPNKGSQLFILQTFVTSVTLLAYTLDTAFSIKLLCDRGHA